jgi:cytidylate kinase
LTVAISRQAGARGTTIARKVADILDWQVFDHDTLDYLTQNETARGQLLADIPADALKWADAQLAHLQRDCGLNAKGDALKLVRLVLTVAARGNVVIVGRAAGFMLPPETTIHARIIAPLESRIAYMAQSLRLTRPEAAEEVRARDERRALFLDHALARDPSDLTAYDVVVNSDRLGAEAAAQFIGWAVRTKQMFAELAEPSNMRSLNTLDELLGA